MCKENSKLKEDGSFLIGDETDKALVITLAHEYLQCKNSFDEFTLYGSLNIFGLRQKAILIRKYNSYVNFLKHLYEFYLGCLKRDKRNINFELCAKDRDKFFNNETEKLLRIKRESIQKGYAPAGENDLSTYEIPVPSKFGEHFREIRNIHSHTNLRRATGKNIKLGDFFEKYHKFIYMLYAWPSFAWVINDVEKHYWGEIEKFDSSVRHKC